MTAHTPPRITLLNRLFWPRRFGGLEHMLWQYSNALADLGVQVHVVTEAAEGSPAQEQARPGLTVQRHDPVDFGRLWRVGELVQARWWRQAIEQMPDTDFIWTTEPTAARAAIRAGYADRLIYFPVICYEGITRVARSNPAMRSLEQTWLSRRLDRYAYRNASVVLTQSHNLRNQHRQYYGPRNNGLVIPSPGDTPTHATCQRERFGLSPNHFVIGFVGRPGDPVKDLPFLIDAIKSTPMPDHMRLLIVGGGDGMDHARQRIADAGLTPKTLFTGNLKDPSPAYAAMDAFVLPSQFETFGNVIVEAHAHGLPALGRATDVASSPPIYTASDEIIDHGVTGYVVDPHDASDLGDKLRLLAENTDLAKQMGQQAKARADSYTWADAAERVLQALGQDIQAAAPARQAA